MRHLKCTCNSFDCCFILTNLAGKFLWETFCCYLHVNHTDMHMASTCSQNTVSTTHLWHTLCLVNVCICTHAWSSLLLHSCCKVCCLGCHVILCHKLTLHLGSLVAPKHSPQGDHLVMMIILSICGFWQSCCIVGSLVSIHAP